MNSLDLPAILSLKHEMIQSSQKKSSSTNKIVRRVKGRQKPVTISAMTELRIMKRDIRRRYIEMYTHFFNIHDDELLNLFFQEFWSSTCTYQIHFPSQPPLIWKTIPSIFQHITESRAMIPDGVQYLRDVRIHVSLDRPGSRIVANAFFQGTILYQQSELISTNGENVEVNDINRPISTSGLLPNRKLEELIIHSVLTMTLDQNHRIEMFRMDITKLCQQPLPMSFNDLIQG